MTLNLRWVHRGYISGGGPIGGSGCAIEQRPARALSLSAARGVRPLRRLEVVSDGEPLARRGERPPGSTDDQALGKEAARPTRC